MIDIWQAPEEFSRIVHVSEEGDYQVRLTVNSFRGREYLHLRKYYLSFEEEWLPTKDGIAMPKANTKASTYFIIRINLYLLCKVNPNLTFFRGISQRF